jgi:hypothetical protein
MFYTTSVNECFYRTAGLRTLSRDYVAWDQLYILHVLSLHFNIITLSFCEHPEFFLGNNFVGRSIQLSSQ